MAPPTGARVRTRLRLTPADEAVVWAVGAHLGRLAGADLAWRLRLGHARRPGDDQRADRKRALTAEASSRWAGTITRTSNDQWDRAYSNLLDTRMGLRLAVIRIRARLAVPVGQTRGQGRGRVRGYQTRMERFQKQGRLQHLQASLTKVEERIAQGRVSVCRGGRRLAKLRHALNDAEGTPAPTEAEWRVRWQGTRLFLHADGEAGSHGGTRLSGFTRISSGWRSDCQPHWRTYPIPSAGHRPTGCRALWSSAIVGRSGRRRRPTGRSGTTSSWIRPRSVGMWTHPGDFRHGKCHR
jgi:hypothetical protein